MEKKITFTINRRLITLIFSTDRIEPLQPEMEKEELKNRVNALDLSAKAKALLWSLVDRVVVLGGHLWKLGQKVVEMVIGVVEQFPSASVAAVAGLTLKALLDSIPLIGWLLGPVVGTIAAVLLLSAGVVIDLHRQVKEGVYREARDFRRATDEFCHP